MVLDLRTALAREQRAFLARPRDGWSPHLSLSRAFLAEAFRTAPPNRPLLVLGAGSGLEVPWATAPRGAVGWDADPGSRLRTALRHRRWVPWVFDDLTGGFAELAATLGRCLGHPWSGRRRAPKAAVARLQGLLLSLDPRPRALEAWLDQHRPGQVVAANVFGQVAPLAHGLVTEAFAPFDPWESDPERTDPLAEALEAWVARSLGAVAGVLRTRGVPLWSLHDRGVVHGDIPVALGAPVEPWTAQLRAAGELELSDPWCGLEPVALLGATRVERWLWPVGPGQLHVVEALVGGGDGPSGGPEPLTP